jgi:radical SAM protein with 4Fe4S-binding SPASM domain
MSAAGGRNAGGQIPGTKNWLQATRIAGRKANMKYLLNPSIALRSWQLVPYAYYIKNNRNALGLKKEEFELLALCDGGHELGECALLDSLIERGFCHPCEHDEQLSDWQKPLLCQNRYFPGLNWAITCKCNYNCLHCFNAADNERLTTEFTWDECVRLMEEAQSCGINAFTLTGGEPMIHPHFLDIVKGIHSRGMYVEELNTNGSFITEKILDEMKQISCDPLIKISFDGLGHHDWLRNRSGAEGTALAAISLCIRKGFRLKVQTNVHRLNCDTMLPTAELMDSLGVAEMRIIRTTEAPRWAKNSDGLCEGGACLNFAEYYNFGLKFAQEYIAKQHKMNIDIWQFLQFSPTRRTYHRRPVDGGTCYRDSFPVCRGNRGMVAVNANGNVLPCMQMSGYYEMQKDVLGNVKTDGLKNLLTTGRYLDEICVAVGTLAQKNEKCGKCRHFRDCMGGCRAIGLALTADKFGSDWAKCFYFYNGYLEKTDKVFMKSGYECKDP